LSKKLSKEDVKAPDQVLKTLNQGFQWSQTHAQILVVAVIVFVVLGIGSSLYNTLAEKKEVKAQEAYFPLEKSYLDKKRDFEEAERPLPPMANKTPAAPSKVKASGDLEKDYGPEVAGLQKVMESYPSSKAAQMAALNLSELYLNYKKPAEASQALQKVEKQSGGSDLVSVVVLTQYGNVLADQGDCKGALEKWQKVLNHSEASFLHDTLRLKSAFCYEKLNEMAKAEELYKKVSQNSQDPKNPQAGEMGLGKEAEKYLRLLKIKKNAG